MAEKAEVGTTMFGPATDRAIQIDKLNLGPEDVIVIRNVSRREAQDLLEEFRNLGTRYHNPILFIHSTDAIETISRERMRSIGYIHEEDLKPSQPTNEPFNPNWDEG